MNVASVLHSLGYALDFLREQVSDVRGEDLTLQPRGVAYHPAWTIGHVTLVLQNIGGVIGLDPWLPGDWSDRFGSAATAQAELYGGKDELLDVLADAELRVTCAVRKLDLAALDAPFPDPSYSDVFPTVGHALTQVLVAHTANHVGQISVWRRAMGLPPMPRGFE